MADSISENDLEKILDGLNSDSAKLSVLGKLFDKGVDIPKKQLYMLLRHYENTYEQYKAKYMAITDTEELGYFGCYHPDLENAKLYCYRAAKVAEKAGLLEKAIMLLEWSGSFSHAALVAEKAGLHRKAIQLYEEKLRDYSKAAELAEKVGLHGKAIQLYEEKLRDYSKATEVAERVGLTEKAKQLYLKQMELSESEGRYSRAAALAEKAGFPKKAEAYRKLAELLK